MLLSFFFSHFLPSWQAVNSCIRSGSLRFLISWIFNHWNPWFFALFFSDLDGWIGASNELDQIFLDFHLSGLLLRLPLWYETFVIVLSSYGCVYILISYCVVAMKCMIFISFNWFLNYSTMANMSYFDVLLYSIFVISCDS